MPRTVGPAPTVVRLRSLPGRVPEGGELVLSAHVRRLGPVGELPQGRVTFRAGAVVLGTAAVGGDGCARLVGVRLAAGVHALTASYGGDGEHAAAVSPPLPQVVTAAAARVAVLVPVPRAVEGGTLLEAELVDSRSGRLVDSAPGPLVFEVGGTVVAVADLREGHARVVVADLPEGPLRVAFEGDAEHAPASGSPVGAA